MRSGLHRFLRLLRFGDQTDEDVILLQRQLEGVGDTRHVMAATRPPHHVEGAFNPEVIDHANPLMWIAHNLERLADRVANICERTVFIATGELLEFDTDEEEEEQA